MAPLLLQLVAWAVFSGLGAAGLMPSAATLPGALRFSLAVMFAFTALSHFLPRTRPDLIRMVPPRLPQPGLLVTITGLFEAAGAVGLWLRPWTWWAGHLLAALLIALFPANIHAARAGLQIAGRRATPLPIRLPMQIFWIACLMWVAATHL